MTKMNVDILNVINAVLDYKRFIISNNIVAPKTGFDWFKETEAYYHSLSLPDEMKKNRSDFERILGYNRDTLDIMNNMNKNELCELVWKNY